VPAELFLRPVLTASRSRATGVPLGVAPQLRIGGQVSREHDPIDVHFSLPLVTVRQIRVR
jgi:hypothetical protein